MADAQRGVRLCGVDDHSAWVGRWAPGADETLLGTGVGYPLPPGSLLVMQVHHNLLPTGGSARPTDGPISGGGSSTPTR
jgi:hypothetical protein